MVVSLFVRLNAGTYPRVLRLAFSKGGNLQITSQYCFKSYQGSSYVGNKSSRFFSTSQTPGEESKAKEGSVVNVTNGKDGEKSLSSDAVNHEYRERFIPITRKSIIRYLIEEKDFLTDDEKKAFPRFARSLDRSIVNQYQGVLGELKNLFDPLNPDKDTVQTREWSRREKLDNEFWLLQQLEDVMEKANFHELPKPMVENILKEHHINEGVRVSVDLNRYDVLRFWVLGYERPEVSLSLTERLSNAIMRRKPREAMEYYKRVIVAIRLKKDSKLNLKAFKEVPVQNLEMLLPDGTVQMSTMDKGVLVTSVAIAAVGILAKVVTHLAQLHVDWTLIVTSITGLIAFRAWSMYKNRRNEYLIKVTQMLYYKNVANNRSLLALLVDRAEDESFKQILLTYTFLLTSRPAVYRNKPTTGIPSVHMGGLTKEELAEEVEKWIEDRAGVNLSFDPSEAVTLLTNLGLISVKDDKLVPVMLDVASGIMPSIPRSLMTKDLDVLDGYDRDVHLETEEEYKANDKKRSKYGWF